MITDNVYMLHWTADPDTACWNLLGHYSTIYRAKMKALKHSGYDSYDWHGDDLVNENPDYVYMTTSTGVLYTIIPIVVDKDERITDEDLLND